MAGVKGKSGRKPKSLETAHTTLSIAESGEDAARLIKEVAKGALRCPKCGGIFKPDKLAWENAWRIVEQLIGRPAQKIQQEIEGELGLTITGDMIARAYFEFEPRGEGQGMGSLPE